MFEKSPPLSESLSYPQQYNNYKTQIFLGGSYHFLLSKAFGLKQMIKHEVIKPYFHT